MLVIIDFYKLLFNENKEKIIAKNLNYPYNRSEI